MALRGSGLHGVPRGNNWSVCEMPIAGFVLRQKLIVQMGIGAALCFLGLGGWFDCSRSCCPGFGPQVSFKPYRSQVALGLEFAPWEECVLCVVGRRHLRSNGGEVRPPHERRVGLGRMAVF